MSFYSTEYWDKYYNSHADCLELDKKYVETLTIEPNAIGSYMHINWLSLAVYFNHTKFINMYMQANDVPENLSFKEKICWLHLCKGS